MLGSTVYYLNFKDKSITEGIVKDMHITSTGYGAYLLLTSDGIKQAELSICFDTYDEALKVFEEKNKIADEIKMLVEETNKKVECLRKQLIGEPTLTHLLDK